MILKEVSQTQHIVTIMAEIITAQEYRAKSAKGKVHRSKSGKPGASFEFSPSEVTQDALDFS